MNVRTLALAGLVAATTLAAACGDDDASDSATTTTVPATTVAPSTSSSTSSAPASTAGAADVPAVCALATEMNEQESFPTRAQLSAYQAIAPEAIASEVTLGAAALSAAPDGDVLSFFKAAAKDDVESALRTINQWEADNCGIEHDDLAPPPGASWEVEPDAARIDVRSEDFTLTASAAATPGRTSFVLTNHGAEVHHLVIFQLADGVKLADVLAVEDSGDMVTGFWSTGLAFPDGEDEEAITFDLAAGNYGMACFVAGADGTPHAFSHDMTAEFTVA
jgi:hypothetical protein